MAGIAATVHRPCLALVPSSKDKYNLYPLYIFKSKSNPRKLLKSKLWSKTSCHFSAMNAVAVGGLQRKPKPALPHQKPEPTSPHQKESNDDSRHVCEKIRKLFKEKKYQEALDIFRIVKLWDIDIDVYTYAFLIQGCIAMKNLEEGKQVHSHMVESGVEPDLHLANKLVIMYVKCGNLSNARQLFDKMPQRNVEAWNSMISGHAQRGESEEATELFCRMRTEGVEIDEYTVTSVLRACAGLSGVEPGQQVHACVVKKKGFQQDVFVASALIDMYAKCGSTEDARYVFDKMPERNVVSWNAMIAGYVQHGDGDEALRLFYQMQLEGTKVDRFTLATIVRVCVCFASLEQAKELHAGIVRGGYGLDLVLGSALLDLYSKWGRIEDARHVFDTMPERNVISWNSMIAGYANRGCGREAIQLFDQMREEGIKPNHVTFLAVLSACSYSGLMDEGWRYFHCIGEEYGKFPRSMHYTCMVELLGRTGHLNEAYDLIVEAPFEPTVNMWGALLCACRVHEDMELGTFAAERLIELGPKQIGNYVVLFNIYAGAGRWKDATRVKQIMEGNGIKEEPVCSWIDIKKGVHIFYVGDRLHPQAEEIYAMLEELTSQIREVGYVPDTKSVFPDVPDQMQCNVSYHSEKLATSFGIISTHPTTTFQIVQKHRICADCHTAIKLISQIVSREIVVRDASHFHYFNHGMCSCGDYW